MAWDKQKIDDALKDVPSEVLIEEYIRRKFTGSNIGHHAQGLEIPDDKWNGRKFNVKIDMFQ